MAKNDGNRTDFEDTMKISYKKLWHLLIDKDMTKTELQKAAGLSWASVAKLNRGENIGYIQGMSLPPIKVVKLAVHRILNTYISYGHLRILQEVKELFPIE